MLESSGNAEWIFLEVVKRRGSVSALGGIAPEHLHVLCKRASDNEPGRWLALTDTQDEDIFVYSTAVQPPVVPDIPFE